MRPPVAADLVLPMQRPEYVTTPEVLISSLAWRVLEVGEGVGEGGRPLALAYRTGGRVSTTLDFRSTEPEPQAMDAFGSALVRAGIDGIDDQRLTGEAVATSIAGVRALKARGQAAIPLTPATALLQNTRGMMGKRNPPNFGQIVESLFALGRGAAGESTASELWLRAARRRTEGDDLLRMIDAAVAQCLLPSPPQTKMGSGPEAELHAGFTSRTPFRWFAEAWSKLTSELWVDALPARRWVDWATTILRAAIGFGFLWEARFYEQLARAVLSGRAAAEPLTLSDLSSEVGVLVPWASRRERTSVRDVASRLKESVQRGDSVRNVLLGWLSDQGDGDLSPSEALRRMANDPSFVAEMESALSQVRNSGANTWEAVRYSLLTRDRSGPFADHYGLLATRGRYLLVEPATEWVAVMASLTAPHPSGYSSLGDVRRSLLMLGLSPDLRELIDLLESAGLARGSADADQAVVVQSAY